MLISINGLRKLIGALAVLFPLMLVFGGLMGDTPVQESLSAYYWTNAGVLFSGFIITFGIILTAYNGYDRGDRIITAFAAGMMFLVALFPMQGPHYYLFQFVPRNAVSIIHYVSAGGAFSLMGVMSVWQFRKGHEVRPLTRMKLVRNKVYMICGILIFASILGMLLIELIPGAKAATNPVRLWFIVESICPVAFGFSWYVKGGGFWAD